MTATPPMVGKAARCLAPVRVLDTRYTISRKLSPNLFAAEVVSRILGRGRSLSLVSFLYSRSGHDS